MREPNTTSALFFLRIEARLVAVPWIIFQIGMLVMKILGSRARRLRCARALNFHHFC